MRTIEVTTTETGKTLEAVCRVLTLDEADRTSNLPERELFRSYVVSVHRDGEAVDLGAVYEDEAHAIFRARRRFFLTPPQRPGT